MKGITQKIAQALVDDPEQVNLSVIESGHTSILRLRVGQGEAGKIIGRRGRTIEAFRTILNAVAAKEKKRVILEIADDEDPSERSMPRPRLRYNQPDSHYSQEHFSNGNRSLVRPRS